MHTFRICHVDPLTLANSIMLLSNCPFDSPLTDKEVLDSYLNPILNFASHKTLDCNMAYLINAWGNRRCSNKNNKRSKLCSSQDLQCLG